MIEFRNRVDGFNLGHICSIYHVTFLGPIQGHLTLQFDLPRPSYNFYDMITHSFTQHAPNHPEDLKENDLIFRESYFLAEAK
ncbi:hypothetical protein EYC80_008997 [Monilinia laxa]|uniref:Uncharacterized protein n=1 Tax=Monilinia laxa TaxID=61186 RepID=A0A5N6K228_MONLA|nr:hypothetical protein EYC80_008997 [Monilinia laxa]